MKIWFLGFCIAGLLAYGCKEKEPSGVVLEADVNIIFLDQDGNNLLSKASNFQKGMSSLVYIVNGKETASANGNLDSPGNFSVLNFEADGKYKGQPFVRLFVNTIDESPVTTSILKWNDGSKDSIRTEIDRDRASAYVSAVWFNDKLIWDREIGRKMYESGEVTSMSRFSTVVK